LAQAILADVAAAHSQREGLAEPTNQGRLEGVAASGVASKGRSVLAAA